MKHWIAGTFLVSIGWFLILILAVYKVYEEEHQRGDVLFAGLALWVMLTAVTMIAIWSINTLIDAFSNRDKT